jgi:hypothetical protein
MVVSGHLHNPTVLPPGKQTPVYIGYEVGWASKPIWMLWRGEKSLSPDRNRTPFVQLVAVPTKLSRLGHMTIFLKDYSDPCSWIIVTIFIIFTDTEVVVVVVHCSKGDLS